MKKQQILFLILLLGLSSYLSAAVYPKVIMKGDYPDPSIIRDGKDYYMTHSSFYYLPGLQIWHSQDLTNWESIGYAITTNVGSVFAPDLVKHNGRYYIYFPAGETNWVVWADDIRGKWSKPIDLKIKGIDPGHVVGEDGKRYLYLNEGIMVQLSDDGLSIVGKPEKLYDGWVYPEHWDTECMCLESPKLIRKDGYFYMISAEGGTAGPATSHMVVAARSKSVRGPWENSPYNPIVHTYSDGERWWSKGHGTLIDDVDGNWWMVYHAYEKGYHTLGRQTLIEPMQWLDDGWFRSRKIMEAVRPNTSLADKAKPSLYWSSWKEYNAQYAWKDGKLSMRGKGASPKNASLQLAIVPDKNYEAQVEVTLGRGAVGGLLLFYNEVAFAGISSDGKSITLYEDANKQSKVANSLGNHFYLKIVNRRNVCSLQISRDGSEWETIKDQLDVSGLHHNNHGGFYSLRLGLMAAGSGEVRFENFTYNLLPGRLFAYSTDENNNKNGLHLSWSEDGKEWNKIGPEFSFLRSDYGNWGTEKRLINPLTFKGEDGLYHCLWMLNECNEAIGHASTRDFVHWSRQAYPSKGDKYYELYQEKAAPMTKLVNLERGTYLDVSLDFIDNIRAEVGRKEERESHYWMKEEVLTGKLKETIRAEISLIPEQSKKISDNLMGIFYEDLNYAADGGLYAELVQNRDFEYSPEDVAGNNKNWNAFTSWELQTGAKGKATFTIDTVQPIHPNNPHYAVLDIKHAGKGIAFVNEGFDGIVLKAGESYNFSLFAKGKTGKLSVQLLGKNGEIFAEAQIDNLTAEWKKYTGVLTSNQDVSDARLAVRIYKKGSVSLDMISLFPQKTFKNRPNGLRADLAQTIADLKPRFVRFPGGCLAHGDGLGNMYRWKNTVGPLESRVPQGNIWRYHQTAGLGYFEFFQFCEDIGAEPVPVVPAGVCCQNSSYNGQKGLPMCEMHDYAQEILDLIEYANGPANSKWGRVRVEAGHPEPFNLKYVGIGNEDLISEVFEERFTLLYNAVKAKHPEITIIGTAGPFNEGTDYEEGWAIADKLGVPVMDEHYYQSPGWFINNQDFYDSYNRQGAKVYLGEYAAHIEGRHNNMETALAEAIYLTSLERNADIVSMASYAPLLAKEGRTQWNPDLIYFTNAEVKPTVGYYVQQLFGVHTGNEYIPSWIDLTVKDTAVERRVAASVVRDMSSGDLIIKLVNRLPVAVQPSVNLGGIPVSGMKVSKTVLQGALDDKTAKPQTSGCTIEEMQTSVLPAYSLTVYRISEK
ncbi:beta-xylosidase/alpha-L-arabinofuranosidase [Parabacteroides sp. PF5-5]|uniref:family 43 glycosylhydrolase n=1 Tax=unclassified Parabacteroides TaxID=2649774 RepID=UPI0024748DFA|nr:MULTISPECIES: family 43 glycosylhydrolase [unclassified Parabacteroides]MDH6304303.1 beta-xylosidase/alpha-L-arabinofuranosidase [Parabacteroides sp. PH5-39]MDH6315544.1 beta-xylosidase/alpha-L-arabinofuranosidase [Parabacteroides sp. PF5-13]MDH6318962.1 beta-xylosidase/alpha-L-arabinofuranosidase [Parabacteroides sp. PH5-13]MDH6322691.1 beta-xylosidase/alpha-L-arabinofuranosidase [Parabacteroides sp. PH5-8]MDH6326737.1 beta-xylosidase/alpha-L-arabinofuranosidase [Parabacteroides sp. PH5-41